MPYYHPFDLMDRQEAEAARQGAAQRALQAAIDAHAHAEYARTAQLPNVACACSREARHTAYAHVDRRGRCQVVGCGCEAFEEQGPLLGPWPVETGEEAF